jgi:hypothetical protein
MIGYDNLSVNMQMLLGLPFEEGTGAITRDIAKPHHQDIDLINTPTWASLASGLGVIQLNGTNEYLELASADSLDLDFTTEDYSIGGWVYWSSGDTSQIIIGRYDVDVAFTGWELYLTEYGGNLSLTIRNHHSLTIVDGHPRSACTSTGWTQDTWLFFGVSRASNSNAVHYRNGEYVPVSCSNGGMVNPESNANDLIIGTRFNKTTNWLKGMLWGLRVWNRPLSESDWKQIYEMEEHWFA